MTALEIMQIDKFERSNEALLELENYANHVENVLQPSDSFKDISFDQGMFFR